MNAHTADRIVHDADSHIIEPPGWLESYASEYVRDNADAGLIPMDLPILQPVLERAKRRLAGEDPETTEAMMLNPFAHREKYTQWTAYAANDTAERKKFLDLTGMSGQVVFPSLAWFRVFYSKDLRVQYEGAEAINRGMADFCSVDERLKAVGFVPLNDPERALGIVKQGIELGVSTFWLLTDAVEGRSPAHVAYDPIWAVMQEAGIPITLHIGSTARRFPSDYMETGVERVVEGGGLGNLESTRPHDVPVLHHTVDRWLTAMIYFGVLERFPRLKIGIIELGANWVPATLMNLDMGVSLLGKFDQSLKKLSLKPSEYMQRQVRVTPFHTENTGWILRNVGKEMLMFNTDYPHPEGGSDPFGSFERSLDAVNPTPEELDHFYSKNFESYMGL
jgi:predicted TIM-barrel fold metal-dependent hydrolase